MRTRVLRSIRQMDPLVWDGLVGRNRLICRHAFLRAVESAGINDCKYWYVVVEDDHGLVAHTCVYSISTELDSFAQGWLKKSVAAMRNVWTGFCVMRSLECGCPVALGSTISFRRDADSCQVAREIIAAVEDIAVSCNTRTLLFRDFEVIDPVLDSVFANAGFRRINNLPHAVLDIKWKSFAEYLSDMRSEYRSKLLALRRRCSDAGVVIDIETDVGKHAVDFARLWFNTYNRASEYRREVLTPAFFREVGTNLGDRSAVLVAVRGGMLIGFLLILFDDETILPLYCGMDYERSRESGVYFNLFYKAIEVGLERGFRSVDMGITTLAPKVDLGAVVRPLYMYMKHTNAIMNAVIPQAFARLTPENTLVERNVFRKKRCV